MQETQELWKPIKGFEGRYEISNTGRVKSLARMRKSARGGMAPLPERILKLKIDKNGYVCVHLRADEITKYPHIHRLVAEAFIENTDNKPTVNHKDGNKQSNTVQNLEWSTHSEQTNHALNEGLMKLRGSPKFSKKFKQEIHEYYKETGCSIMDLVRKFGISERTAGRAAKGVVPRTTTRVLKDGSVIIEDILTKEQVAEIISLREQGWVLERLAEKFNRSISQIFRIVKKQSRVTDIE